MIFSGVLPIRRILTIRRRYVFTRRGIPRIRYSFATFFLCMAFVSTGMKQGSAHFQNIAAVPYTAKPPLSLADNTPASSSHSISPVAADVLQSGISEGIRKASVALVKPPMPLQKTIKVKTGDTVGELLQENGLTGPDAYKAVRLINKHFNVTRIKPGQVFQMYYKPGQNDSPVFEKIVMDLSPVKTLTVYKADVNEFAVKVDEKETVKRQYAYKTEIETSLYGSAERAGIPARMVAELIRLYSWSIDFQRDVRRGDTVELLYEVEETEEGHIVDYGNILYAALNVNGRDRPIYRFTMKDGHVDYFEPDGQSIRKVLMKTPVDGARISSGFGMRRHPVLGYNKMHKGVDFSAPTGTPIYAAGDGIIEYAARNGGYGNYVRLRHNGSLKTAYAHMHKFARGIKKGRRVKQGDIIGYVGSTGRSTGPHLHYEVLKSNQQVNPNSITLPIGQELKGTQLANFKNLVSKVGQQYAQLTQGIKLAGQVSEKGKDVQ